MPDGVVGAQDTLYFTDSNSNGQFDPGEDIWFSQVGATFDAGPDGIVATADDVSILIYQGIDGIQITCSCIHFL